MKKILMVFILLGLFNAFISGQDKSTDYEYGWFEVGDCLPYKASWNYAETTYDIYAVIPYGNGFILKLGSFALNKEGRGKPLYEIYLEKQKSYELVAFSGCKVQELFIEDVKPNQIYLRYKYYPEEEERSYK